MVILNVLFLDEMCRWIDEKVKMGKYVNVSDYICDLVCCN